MARSTMQTNAVAMLEAIVSGCQSQTWYILGQVNSTNVVFAQSVMGSTKQPDFFFTAGKLSPSTIQPGGTTNLTYSVSTQCRVNSSTRVGVYLSDANFQSMSFLGALNVPAWTTPYNQGSVPITFSSSIAPGTYQIVLFADYDGVFAESNENNNGGYVTLTVASGARAALGREESTLQVDLTLPDGFVSTLPGVESVRSDASLGGF